MSEKTKIAFLGGSRGFGAQVLKNILKNPDVEVLLVSRSLPEKIPGISCDLTKNEDQQSLLKALGKFKPNKIFYFAGGGPFGFFNSQSLSSHLWALELMFLFPIKLLHWAGDKNFIKQVVFMGSAIAESSADPKAASYSAAKHGLLGLLSSIQAEGNSIDLRLFSPGYMDTQMLPQGAEIRKTPGAVLELAPLADKFTNWIDGDQENWHLEIKDQSHLLK